MSCFFAVGLTFSIHHMEKNHSKTSLLKETLKLDGHDCWNGAIVSAQSVVIWLEYLKERHHKPPLF